MILLPPSSEAPSNSASSQLPAVAVSWSYELAGLVSIGALPIACS